MKLIVLILVILGIVAYPYAAQEDAKRPKPDPNSDAYQLGRKDALEYRQDWPDNEVTALTVDDQAGKLFKSGSKDGRSYAQG